MNSKQVNATVNRLISFMGDVQDGNLKTILANMQTMCEYQAEKLRIYEEHLAGLTGKSRPELSDSDKRRLAQKGKTLNDYLLSSVESTWAPGTLRHWYNTLVGAIFDGKLQPRGSSPAGFVPVDAAVLPNRTAVAVGEKSGLIVDGAVKPLYRLIFPAPAFKILRLHSGFAVLLKNGEVWKFTL